MFGKAFNRRIKKETFILEEEIQGYLDLLKEIPIEDKEKDLNHELFKLYLNI